MSIDTQAYLFVHFIGEERNPTDEQLYFALSRDGVHWRESAPGRQSGVDVARRREGRGATRILCATHVVDSTLWPPI